MILPFLHIKPDRMASTSRTTYAVNFRTLCISSNIIRIEKILRIFKNS
ncbi:hypothetical protein B0G52_112139 [Cohnella sp. SGD-V74]|nr:hypothetical protein B0G52_112139 [Cohnella sp. SGD-V74]